MRRLIALLVLGFLVTLPASPTLATYPGENGKIAFERSGEIWTMNPDGSDQQALVGFDQGFTLTAQPSWRSDGVVLVFSGMAGIGEPQRIWSVQADGTDLTQLVPDDPGAANSDYQDQFPGLSPDGSRVVFSSDRDGAGSTCGPMQDDPCDEIYVHDLSSGQTTRLTDDATDDINPEWSPDGTKIAFASNRTGTYQIHVMDADGSGATRITSGLDSVTPSWSPDGAKIAFAKGHNDCSSVQLFVIDADGSNETQMTCVAGVNSAPSWSPDGSTIAYHGNQTPGGTFEIFTIPADQPLADATGLNGTPDISEFSPAWQPAGVPELPEPKSFDDVPPDHTFAADIAWLASEGITKGCNPPENTLFCPDDFVTRGQMAAFLVRGMGYTDDGGGDLFVDDDGSTFENDIDKLGTAGVTKGCNPPENTEFCPDDFVTRGQMAAFLVRALGLTDDGGGDLFVDDDGSTFENDIDKLGTAGVTKGCNPPENTEFCPDDFVTRGQMAAFLHRALGP